MYSISFNKNLVKKTVKKKKTHTQGDAEAESASNAKVQKVFCVLSKLVSCLVLPPPATWEMLTRK